MLTASGLHVALVAVLEDDRRTRAVLEEMAACKVEVGAVKLVPVSTGLVVVDASGALSGLVSDRGRMGQVSIPPSWSSRVLLLSGLSPITSRLAALCKAARKARREGSTIVLDLVGRLRDWNGHDPRVISMLLREADVVCCSLFDLAAIGTDATTVRRAMRRTATLVLDHDDSGTAVGTFGEVRVPSPAPSAAEILAATCIEYARPGGPGETPAARWHRILRRERRDLRDHRREDLRSRGGTGRRSAPPGSSGR
jgi:sugar/nucleoside kinase (ribokinase family)